MENLFNSKFTLDIVVVCHRKLLKHWKNIKASLEWKSWCWSSLLFVPTRHMGTWTCIIICLHYSTLQVAVAASSSFISFTFLSFLFIIFFVAFSFNFLIISTSFSQFSRVNLVRTLLHFNWKKHFLFCRNWRLLVLICLTMHKEIFTFNFMTLADLMHKIIVRFGGRIWDLPPHRSSLPSKAWLISTRLDSDQMKMKMKSNCDEREYF